MEKETKVNDTPTASGAETGQRLLVTGRGGLLAGVRKVLTRGANVAVGRSRGCDISLRRTRGFLGAADPLALLWSDAFRKVSRVHCEVALLDDGRVEVRGYSRNGTFVDGAKVIGTCVLAPDEEKVVVTIGDESFGTLVLEPRQVSGVESRPSAGLRKPDGA